MKIFTHNFNPESNSGPNKFTRTLFSKMLGDKKISITGQAEADIEFCLIQQQVVLESITRWQRMKRSLANH